MTLEYLQQRLAKWETSNDLDALLRAADSLDLLTDGERQSWTSDRTVELAAAIAVHIQSRGQ